VKDEQIFRRIPARRGNGVVKLERAVQDRKGADKGKRILWPCLPGFTVFVMILGLPFAISSWLAKEFR